MCVEYVETLLIRMTMSVHDCAAQYGSRKNIDCKEVWWEGEGYGMVSWVWRGRV
jgi:hypothetical protein